MPDPIPEPILSRAQMPPSNGRPVRKDEIELHDRGIYIESWLPERRSRRKPLLFVHGELAGSWVWERFLGYFAGPRLGGPRPQPAQPLLVADGRPRRACRSTRTSRTSSRRSTGWGRRPWPSGTAWARCWPSRPPSGWRSPGLVLIAPQLPRDLRPPVRPYELREVPEVYGRSVIGWETLPEKLLRDDRDLTLADVLRIQHMLGQKPHESGAARRQVLAGIPVDRRVVAGGAAAGHRGRS